MTRKIHFAETKAQRRAAWMAAFSDAVVTLRPHLAGRIDWASAAFYFFQGIDPTEAAGRYIESATPTPPTL